MLLECLNGAWRVAHVSVRVPGRPTSHHQRVGGWPANAAMEPLAAALALFTIKEARSTLPSMNADGFNERVLVEWCATLWRNANGDICEVGERCPRRAAGAGPRRLAARSKCHDPRPRRAGGATSWVWPRVRLPGQFEVRVVERPRRRPRRSLQVFVATVGESAKARDPRPPTPEGRPPVGHHAGPTETDVAIRAKARVRRENIHGRPCLTICGCREGRPEKLPLLEGVLEDLAMLLSECGWHVIRRTAGRRHRDR